jgi:hypothetical protein
VNGETWVKNHHYIEINTGKKAKSMKHRALLLGDSHARGCKDLTKKNLNKEFGFIGLVNPGAKSNDILNTNIDKDMTKDDIVVECAGSNDISKNGANEGISNIINFVKKTSHTNIMVMEALHRHDLADWSCINKD